MNFATGNMVTFSGWWFQTLFIFHNQKGMSSETH